MFSLSKYSDEELKMFRGLGFNDNLIFNVTEVGMYRIAMEHVFCENIQNEYAEGLRRAYKAFRDCKVYRMTPEFNKLIKGISQ